MPVLRTIADIVAHRIAVRARVRARAQCTASKQKMRSSVYAVRPFVRPSVQQQQIPGGSLDDDLLARSYRPFSLRPPLVSHRALFLPLGFSSPVFLAVFLPLSLSRSPSLSVPLSESASLPLSFFLLALAQEKAWRPNEDVSTRVGPRARSCFRPPSVLVALTRQGGFLGPVQAVPSTSD